MSASRTDTPLSLKRSNYAESHNSSLSAEETNVVTDNNISRSQLSENPADFLNKTASSWVSFDEITTLTEMNPTSGSDKAFEVKNVESNVIVGTVESGEGGEDRMDENNTSPLNSRWSWMNEPINGDFVSAAPFSTSYKY